MSPSATRGGAVVRYGGCGSRRTFRPVGTEGIRFMGGAVPGRCPGLAQVAPLGQRAAPPSVPYVALVDLDTVPNAQQAELVLERATAVMLFLILDVTDDGFAIRFRDGERAVAGLPMKIVVGRPFGLDPLGAGGLHLLDEIHHGDFPR